MVRTQTSGRCFALVGLLLSVAFACAETRRDANARATGGAVGSGGFAELTGGSPDDGGGVGGGAGVGGSGDAEGGGAGGDVGAGGEGGAVAVEDGACLPRSLTELVQSCSLIGDCVYAVTDAGYIDTCYDTGETTRYLPKLAASTTLVRRADGEFCYELQSATSSVGSSSRTVYRWLDATGSAIALGRLDELETNVLYVVAEGIRYRVELGSEACSGLSPMPRDTARCEMGACSF